jgi:hypothetical protein
MGQPEPITLAGVAGGTEMSSREEAQSRGGRFDQFPTYDVSRFSGALIVDAPRSHPRGLAGDGLRENPFCGPPAGFQKELAERHAPGH